MEMQPAPADYRLKPEQIDPTRCLRRMMWNLVDKRWAPAVYREYQCRNERVAGSDMCMACHDRFGDCTRETKRQNWNGLITEEPLPWTHMLGTAWSAKCRWTLPEPPMIHVEEHELPVLVEEYEDPVADKDAQIAALQAELVRLRARITELETVANAAVIVLRHATTI